MDATPAAVAERRGVGAAGVWPHIVPVGPSGATRRANAAARGPFRRLGFAVKVVGRPGLRSHDTRRWKSEPDVSVSVDRLAAILDYLDEVDVRMYRLSSDFVPYATHPDLPRFHGQVRRNAARLAEVGRRARTLGVRLSLHPSQYVLLSALDEAITRKGIADVDAQAELLDALEQGPEAVVVLHLGGGYGDRAAAMRRFVQGFRRLSEPARRRLVVENDDSIYTVEDCMQVHAAIGAPVVFDHQHHLLNPGGLSLGDAARAALATWPRGVRPKVHFSSPRLEARTVSRGGRELEVPPLLSQHADYVHPWEFAAFLEAVGPLEFDVMLEAKRKDAALLKLRSDMARHRLW